MVNFLISFLVCAVVTIPIMLLVHGRNELIDERFVNPVIRVGSWVGTAVIAIGWYAVVILVVNALGIHQNIIPLLR
jgi:tRNA G37 N-methylase TrmD